MACGVLGACGPSVKEEWTVSLLASTDPLDSKRSNRLEGSRSQDGSERDLVLDVMYTPVHLGMGEEEVKSRGSGKKSRCLEGHKG